MKKNWYNNHQLRQFELYSTGEIRYYKEKTYKGSITLGMNSQVNTVENYIELFCTKKKRVYHL